MRFLDADAVTRQATTLGLALTAACSSIQPVPLEFISESRPATVDLYTGYGRHVAIDDPRVVGDSVVGTGSKLEYVAVPLSKVERISAKRFSGARTFLLVGGVAVMGALATYALIAEGEGDAYMGCEFVNPRDTHEREACGYNLKTRS